MAARPLHRRGREAIVVAAVVGVVAGVSAGAWGQQRTAPPQRVEQGVGDVGPLSADLRVLPNDLRQPTGFDQVFRLPPSRGNPNGMFARYSGGLVATFPRGAYFNTVGGQIAEVPAGTVFSIGGLPSALTRPLKAPMANLAPNYVSTLATPAMAVTRVDTQVSTLAPGTRTGPVAEAPVSIWTSEPYRQRRVAELLRSAAAAGGGAGTGARR